MGYNAVDIGRTMVRLSLDNKIWLTNLKLQKLLYFAWIEYYRNTRRHLFDDDIEAWKYGPVVPSVYYDFWQYAGSTIVYAKTPSSIVDFETKDFLLSVLEEFKGRDGFELICASVETKAWKSNYIPGLKRKIPHSSMEGESRISVN